MSKKLIRVFYSVALIFALIGISAPASSANAAVSEASPPKNFFRFPFATGRIWRMTGGPHPYGGKTGTLTSLDFAPAWHSGCDIPDNGKDYIVAAAAGKIIYNSKEPYKLTIDHGNKWSSEYFHIAKVLVKSGQVEKGQALGYPSCDGGDAEGAHVHFTIRYDGKTQSIIGASLEGWTVQSTNTKYEGCLQNNITGQKVCKQEYPVPDDSTKTFRAMRTIINIKSAYSGKVFTVNKGSLPNFANDYVIQKTWKGSSDQKWYLIPVDDSYYKIMSTDGGMCLDIEGGYKLSGGKTQRYACNDTDAQRFRFVKVSGNQYYIQAKHSGLMLDIQDRTKTDALILQMPKASKASQYWVMSIQ